MNSRATRLGLALLERPGRVEASLWRRLRCENCARCRELLFERYAAKARAIAGGEFRRRPAYGLDHADFQQLAYSGLLEAIDRYDPLLGAPFEAFAKHRIRGAIADGLARSSEAGAFYSQRQRTERERLRSLRPDAPAKSADPIGALADLTVALAIGLIAEAAGHPGNEAAALNPYETNAWRDAEQRIMEEIDRLQGAEKSIMQHHYVKGVPFAQIADLLSLSKGRISQLHRAALTRIRHAIKRDA